MKINELKYKVLESSYKSQLPHIGSALSCADILYCLYYKNILKYLDFKNPNRDRFILSKGHAATILYCILDDLINNTNINLNTIATPNNCLEEHPSLNSILGIEASTGALGHGIGIAVGLALSAKIRKQSFNTYVLLGDGECNEGSVWESVNFASSHNLNNLKIIIDNNNWQGTGRSLDISTNNLKNQFEAFGCEVIEIAGHIHYEIISALKKETFKPLCIIAKTIKGKDISFMEDDNNWHYKIPNEDDIKKAKEELGL